MDHSSRILIAAISGSSSVACVVVFVFVQTNFVLFPPQIMVSLCFTDDVDGPRFFGAIFGWEIVSGPSALGGKNILEVKLLSWDFLMRAFDIITTLVYFQWRVGSWVLSLHKNQVKCLNLFLHASNKTGKKFQKVFWWQVAILSELVVCFFRTDVLFLQLQWHVLPSVPFHQVNTCSDIVYMGTNSSDRGKGQVFGA